MQKRLYSFALPRMKIEEWLEDKEPIEVGTYSIGKYIKLIHNCDRSSYCIAATYKSIYHYIANNDYAPFILYIICLLSIYAVYFKLLFFLFSSLKVKTL
jgi:hypothetical protein